MADERGDGFATALSRYVTAVLCMQSALKQELATANRSHVSCAHYTLMASTMSS